MVAAAAIGYLLGSLSFARIIGRLVAPSVDVTRVEMRFDDGAHYESRAASASAVRVNIGGPWGLLTGVLDGLKVAAPILVARALGQGEAIEVAVAVGGLVGHVLPVYHRFRGGLGESVIYAVLLVFDPLGLVVALGLSVVAGFAVGRVVVLREAAVPILVAWSLFVRGDPLVASFAALAVLVYRLAALPETRRSRAATRGRRESNEEISREYGMGARLGRAIDRWGVPGIVRRLRARSLEG